MQDRVRFKREMVTRQEAMDKNYYRRTGLLDKNDNLADGRRIFSQAQSPDEMSDEYWRWVRGEYDDHDRIVEKTLETSFNSLHGGEFKMFVYTNKIAFGEHIALVKGDVTADGPVLVRMHALNVLDDVLGDGETGKAGELQQAMRMIGDAGRGVVVLIREPHRAALSDRVRAKIEIAGGNKDAGRAQLRDYGVGAQILLDLGIRDMVLLSNTRRTIIGLEGYGLKVVEQRPIPHSGGDTGNKERS